MDGKARKKQVKEINESWRDIDKSWENLKAGIAFGRKIKFYLMIDPEFEYEFEELNAKVELEKITKEEKGKKLVELVADAEQRRVQFMLDAIRGRETPKRKKRPAKEILKEYAIFVKKRENKLEKLKEKVRKARQKKLEKNPDYQKMIEAFEGMKKRKAELKKKN